MEQLVQVQLGAEEARAEVLLRLGDRDGPDTLDLFYLDSREDMQALIVAVLVIVQVILLTGSESEEDLLAAIKAGARGYIIKDMPFPQLVDSIAAITRGGAVVSSQMAGKLFDVTRQLLRHQELVGARRPSLTGREIEVLELVADGKAYWEAHATRPDVAAIRMRSRISDVFRANLSDEQYREYQKMRSTRQSMRSGQVWVQDDNGDIRPVRVRLGIGDDQYTQISGRNIGEGTVVVTRMRTPRG